MRNVLTLSQDSCSKLWKPKKVPTKEHMELEDFKGRKFLNWGEKNVYVFKKLYSWREKAALLLDESPAYICPAAMIHEAAIYLPESMDSLSKMWNPLPRFIMQVEGVTLAGDEIKDAGLQKLTSLVAHSLREFDARSALDRPRPP